MKEITKQMIEIYRIKKLGYDFMGYEFNNLNSLSYHHLIVARKYCYDLGLGDGFFFWNGAILVQHTSHDYLHVIERIDKDRFNYITCKMIDENLDIKISYDKLEQINDCLNSFENEYSNKYSKNKVPIVKEEYTRRLLKK